MRNLSVIEKAVWAGAGAIAGIVLITGAIELEVFYSSFMKVRITEILQILLTLFIALVVTQYLNAKGSNHSKRADLGLSLLGQLEDSILRAYSSGRDYMARPVKAQEPVVIADIKTLSLRLSLVGKAAERGIIRCKAEDMTGLEHEYLAMKAAITSNWGRKSPKYTEKEKAELDKVYSSIMDWTMDKKCLLLS